MKHWRRPYGKEKTKLSDEKGKNTSVSVKLVLLFLITRYMRIYIVNINKCLKNIKHIGIL